MLMKYLIKKTYHAGYNDCHIQFSCTIMKKTFSILQDFIRSSISELEAVRILMLRGQKAYYDGHTKFAVQLLLV